MANLVIGHGVLLLVGEDCVLLLVARDDHLDAFLEVGLGHEIATLPHGAQRALVDDIRELRARGASRHARDGVEVHVIGEVHLLAVHLEDGLAALEVGQFHGHAAVEAAGAQQRRIEGIGAIRGREDDDAVIPLEAVHLREQLVQRLLALVVAHVRAIALLANRIDLVDEDDAGCLFLGLLEEVAHLRGAHADEHLHELRARDGEERHVRLARHGLGEHRLAGTRRADEQHALRHLRTDGGILLRIVQVIDDFGEVLLRLILTGHILEVDALRGRHVDLGLIAAHAEEHAVATAPLHELAAEILADGEEDDERQDPGEEEAHDGRGLLLDILVELRAGGMQAVDKLRVIHEAGLVLLVILLAREENLVVLDFHLADLLVLRHIHERAVIDLLDLRLVEIRTRHFIE